jgi:mono/diheme cytochrome c family protein
MKRQRSWVLVSLLGSLAGCSPAPPPGGAAISAAPRTAGAPSKARTAAGLFEGNCSPCHQETGEGISGVYPSLAGSPTVLGDPGALARWILKGQRAPTMPTGSYSTAMPKFGWLTDADAAALLTYLRSSFGNQAPPVDATTVASARKELIR